MDKRDFARVIDRWADGEEIEFRVKPTEDGYGSANEWHSMDNPWFDGNFEYRVLSEIERLNVYSRIYEGDDG